MPAIHDLICEQGHVRHNYFFSRVKDIERQMPECEKCKGRMEIYWTRSPVPPPWHARDAVVVFRDAQGHIRYPGRNDVPTPAGCERVELRNLAELRRFEKQNKVVHHATNYDNSGRAIDEP